MRTLRKGCPRALVEGCRIGRVFVRTGMCRRHACSFANTDLQPCKMRKHGESYDMRWEFDVLQKPLAGAKPVCEAPESTCLQETVVVCSFSGVAKESLKSKEDSLLTGC